MNKVRQPVVEDSFSRNSTSVARETVAKMLQRSEELKKKGQIEQTLKILNSLATYNTGTEKIYLARAEVYREKNQPSLALADLTRVIEAGSTNIRAYTLRSEIYRALNQPKKALSDLNQALALEPDNVQVLGKRGAIHRSLHNFEFALRDFKQAIELDQSNAWLYGNRAETYRALNEHRKALNDYNHALELNPTATWVYERRSYSNLWLGYINAAQADFQRSWELYPANLSNGWMAEWTGMYKKGFVFSSDIEQKLENIAAANPEHPAAYLCRAVVLLRQGDFSGSYGLCEIACRLTPDEPSGYFWKALAAAGLKQEKEAFDLLQTALDLDLRPVFLPPPAWAGQINPVFYDKLSQQLFHKAGAGSSENGNETKLLEARSHSSFKPAAPSEIEFSTLSARAVSGENAQATLALVPLETKASLQLQVVKQTTQLPRPTVSLVPVETSTATLAPAPYPENETELPQSRPQLQTPGTQKAAQTPAVEAAATVSAAPIAGRPLAQRQEQPRRLARPTVNTGPAAKPALPPPPLAAATRSRGEEEANAAFFPVFLKATLFLAGLALICLFLYCLFVVFPGLIQ